MTIIFKTMVLVLASLVFMAGLQATTYAETPKQAIQGGVNEVTGTSGGGTQAANNLNKTAANLINILSIVAGAAAVVVLIIGGFRLVSSAGNQESIASARKTIVYAVIGLIVVAVAQLIVHFVLNETTTSLAGTNSSGSSSTRPPCQQLPNGNCRPGTGP